METKKKHELSLAKRMAISLVCGLVAGLAFMFLREHLNASGQAQTWTTINNLLFQDITAEGAERSFGIFYIIGQLFIKALQLVIIPMVFTSISLAIGSIADTRTMGRISAKTLFWFLLCSFLALLLAGCLVLSMVGGAGGAVIAAKSGLLGTGSTVLYQGVEVPSTNGSTVGVSYSAGGGQRSGHHHRKCGDQLLLPAVCHPGRRLRRGADGGWLHCDQLPCDKRRTADHRDCQ